MGSGKLNWLRRMREPTTMICSPPAGCATGALLVTCSGVLTSGQAFLSMAPDGAWHALPCGFAGAPVWAKAGVAKAAENANTDAVAASRDDTFFISAYSLTKVRSREISAKNA